MARRGDLWACVFKGAVLKYCHKANAETERVPRGAVDRERRSWAESRRRKEPGEVHSRADAVSESEPHTGTARYAV